MKDENIWLGYLEEYPAYMTQGDTLDELKENLLDIYKESIDMVNALQRNPVNPVDPVRNSFL